MELKSIPFAGSRAVNALNYFEDEQKRFLTRLIEKGDRSWAGVLFQPKHSYDYIVIMPWPVFLQRRRWSLEDIKEHGVRNDLAFEVRQYIAARFSKNYDRFSNWVQHA